MPFHAGQDGQLWLADQTVVPDSSGGLEGQRLVAKVRSWSFTSTTEILDVTTLGDTDRIYREGLRTGSGNAQIFYYTNDDGTGNLSELINLQMGDRKDPGAGGISKDEPSKFTLKFLIGLERNDPYYLIVRCTTTSFTLSMAVGEISSADMSFQFNGAPVRFRL